MTYIVLEIQTASDGTTAALKDQYSLFNDALNKYYTVLAAAAKSAMAKHAAVLMDDTGETIKKECIHHKS